MHVVWQLSAMVKTPHGTWYGTCVEEVRYDLPPAEGESDEEAKLRAKRHRQREQVALEWLTSGYKRIRPFQVQKKRRTK